MEKNPSKMLIDAGFEHINHACWKRQFANYTIEAMIDDHSPEVRTCGRPVEKTFTLWFITIMYLPGDQWIHLSLHGCESAEEALLFFRQANKDLGCVSDV